MPIVVHPSSVVAPGARLGDDVAIGPFCQVGSDVELGNGCVLLGHSTILGPTVLGQNNRVYPFVTLGLDPQDKSYRGEHSELRIGDNNVFREQVTVHRGTEKGGGVTQIGNDNWLLVGAHVAHDCVIGSGVVLTNLTTLGGHVIVEDSVVCGGHVAIAPFVRLHRACFVAGGARVERDVPPFVIVQGDRARVRALNTVGLERLGLSEASRRALRKAFIKLFGRGTLLTESVQRVRSELGEDPAVRELLDFFARSPTNRSL